VNRLARIAAPVALLVVLALTWEAACDLMKIPVYLLPAPSRILAAASANLPLLAISARNTLVVAALAWALASVAACALALVIAVSSVLEDSVRPLAIALQVTPIVAITPQVIIWTGVDHPTHAVVILAAIVAFFPIFSGALTGLKSSDPDLERLFDLYGAGRIQRLLRLRLPSAAPFVIEGHKVAAGLALVGAVVAEFVAGSGQTQGLAWRILEAGNRLQIDKEFAALAILAVMGSGLYGLLQLAERRLLKSWRGQGR
jgi:NitT/TauT family transport system permease protein